jgi:two-component system NtrC family sensor kinase
MSIEAHRRHIAVSQTFANVAAIAAILLGVMTLLGWAIDNEALRSLLHPRRISMNPATAVCFLLSGSALWFAHDNKRTHRRDMLRAFLAGGVLVIAGIKLIDLLPGINTTVDQILFPVRVGDNRMAPNTAVVFALLAGSLLLLEREHVIGPRPSTSLALFAVAISMLSLTGYLYDVELLYTLRQYIGMALNTAVGVMLLSLGILFARPNRQPIVTLASKTAGGVVARRLVPVAIAVPLLLGWIRLKAERAGIVDSDVGVMLFALSIVAVFLTLIWWIARTLYRLDNKRARAEAAVADSHQLMRTLIDNLPDRIYAKDRDSRFLINNLAHLRVLGAEGQDQVRGKRDHDFLPITIAQPFFEEEQRLIKTGEPMIDQEQRRTSRTGEERWVTASKVPFRNAQGQIVGLVGITHDITAMKHAQAMLHEQNEMLEASVKSEHEAHEALKQAQSHLVQNEKLASLGQMVAGVAHEINNPLSFVANNVAVLQRDLKALGKLLEFYIQANDTIAAQQPELSTEIRDLSEQIDLAYTLPNLQDLLGRSREGLRRIQQIVKDLRDFARLDESDLHEVDLNEGIRSTANIILGLARKQQVKVEMDLADLPTVAVFPAKINQVVMNLLSNAIQASREKTSVTIRSRREGDNIVIQVIDQGSGIPAYILDRIFDPFFTTKPPGEGTGLGLSISYGIVQDHGGTIDVQSEEGKGTTFTVSIPVRRL